MRLTDAWTFRIWFRPRILRNVTNVDWSTKILGHATKMPIYIVSRVPMVEPYCSVALTMHRLRPPWAS